MKASKFFIAILFFCILIRMVIGEPCLIPSKSMEPTLLCGDRGWIDKLTYGGRLPAKWGDIPLINIFTWIRPLREADQRNHWQYKRLPGIRRPQKNDVVVFNSPLDDRLLLVKRISDIIEKGDTLLVTSETFDRVRTVIERDGNSLWRKGNQIYINNSKCDSFYFTKQAFYFVEGDNSSDSKDSRSFGYISEESIVGKLSHILFSINNNPDGTLRWKRIWHKI